VVLTWTDGPSFLYELELGVGRPFPWYLFLVWLWVWFYILWRWFWACYYSPSPPRIQNWSSYYIRKSSRTNQLLVLGQFSTETLLIIKQRKSSHFVGYWRQTGSFYRIKRSFKTSPNDIYSSKLVIYNRFRGKSDQMGFDQKTKKMCRMDRIRFLSGKCRLVHSNRFGRILVYCTGFDLEFQACNDPFFWNVKQMWTEKKIGVRQHHCRSCGKALCEKCSKLRTTIPEQGFEFIPVRCCLGCYESITDSDRIPFATSHQLPTDVSTYKTTGKPEPTHF